MKSQIFDPIWPFNKSLKEKIEFLVKNFFWICEQKLYISWVSSKSVEGFREYVNEILQEKPGVNFICYGRFLEKAKEIH